MLTKPDVDEDVQPLHTDTILETSLAVSHSRRAHLCEPAIKMLGTYPREIKTYVHKKLVQECFWLCYLIN